MTKVIAMAGKGGTGKTTTSALLTRYLLQKKMTPLLLVDADANANLNELLGMEVGLTLGKIRKELKGELPPNMSRDQFMELKIHQALIEDIGFDLLVMGQPDGPGCYCAANQYLAMTMDKLAENYRYIIVDNEAGMEHLSRMNLRTIDYLFITSDPSARGILTAKRISEITGPLGLDVKHQYLLINRAPQPLPVLLQEKIDAAVKETGMTLGGIIPTSNDLIHQELSGQSYLKLGEETEIIQTVTALFDTIFAMDDAQ